ncbi:putative nuclease HARBI1 [Asparagus officinalis]|uniref:putative nuclease HARBI1 n=1 Tax=Asparagus officinalis TaxID=4686 RepID=UPI00098E4E88|nr:putative nuclease HARBI1 [Asparagus officinalis]
MKQASGEVSDEIRCRSTWYPWFENYIYMIDGTHIVAFVPDNIVARFHGRKDGPTQNVLAVVTPNKLFGYVIAGWEGPANDFTVLRDALSMPPPKGLCLIKDKYYLYDTGYTTMPGFIAPYCGVRYHIKEQDDREPLNHHELFNLCHLSLRSKIESTFGILKNRFKILTCRPDFLFQTQVKIVIACCILHNYIMILDPYNHYITEDVVFDESESEFVIEESEVSMLNLSKREQK